MDQAKAGAAWTNFSALQRWIFLGVLCFVAASTMWDRAIIVIVLQQLKTEFHLSDSMLGVISGMPYGICFALSSLPLARLADRYGRRLVLLASAVGWTLMTAFCGLSTTVPFLILSQMGLGLTQGGAQPPSHALIAEYFPPQKRGLAFAVFTAAGNFGTLVASVLGGWIAHAHGWRAAYFAMSALSALVVLMILGVLRDPGTPMRRAAPAKSSFRADLTALMRKRSFAAILIALAFYSTLPFGVILYIPTYLVRLFDLDIATAGPVFGISSAIGTVLGTAFGGLASDYLRQRDERMLLRLPGLVLIADLFIGVVAFSVQNLYVFVLLHVINNALLYAIMPAIFSTVQHVCGSARRATATSAVLVIFNAVGVALAPLMTGALSDFFLPWTGGASLRYALIAMSCMVLPSALVLLWGARHVIADQED